MYSQVIKITKFNIKLPGFRANIEKAILCIFLCNLLVFIAVFRIHTNKYYFYYKIIGFLTTFKTC